MQQTKHIPKDAQVIMSLLRELDIKDHEPRVINQLLEFTYRKCYFEGFVKFRTSLHSIYLLQDTLLAYWTMLNSMPIMPGRRPSI